MWERALEAGEQNKTPSGWELKARAPKSAGLERLI